MVMRLRPVLGSIPLVVAAGCGQPSEQQAVSAQGEVLPSDLGGGYFGQRFFQSFWTEVTPDMAMAVRHELVTYANELDFPATEIVVLRNSYKDMQWTRDLVAVDDTGYCVAIRG